MSKIIGIDLGTTNSCVAVMEGGKPTVIPNAEGARTTPSVVAINNGERLVGQAAKRQAVTNSKNTIFSAKRFIGHKMQEVAEEAKRVPFETVKGKNGEVEIVLDGENKRPAEISAMILQKLKADAEAFLGQTVAEAVITVPAYFNDSQRQATKAAGKIAGLSVKRIINEPTAAALAYGLNKKESGYIAVYDLGGGTFDVSILELDGSEGTFEVKATSGDTHLGGDDFDNVLLDHVVAEFKKDQGMDLSKDSVALQRIKEVAEKTKIELSSQMESEINLPFITADKAGTPKHLVLKITRAKLEELTADLVDKTTEPCEKVLADAGIDKSEIKEVVLVGGMTRMPAIQAKVKEIFNKEPNKGVNPDEVVAIGAAVQGGVLAGDVKDVLLLDVTPLSLGIETMGGIATKLIERNTTIPTKKSQVFSTAADNQPSVEVHVTQGEREFSKDNKSLGRFILDGIPPAPRGIPQIEVTFDIDANGILKVEAHDKGTGKKQNITIQGSAGITDEEIEKMKKEAEEFAVKDKEKRKDIEVRNNAEALVYNSEKTLKEAGDKVNKDEKKPVEEKITVLKDLLKKDGSEAKDIEAASEDLSTAIQKIGAKLYEEAAKNEEASAKTNKKQSGVKGGDDTKAEVDEEKVVEAEVVDESK